MTIKKIFSLIIILNIFILNINFVSARPNSFIDPKAFVKEYLSVKMNTLVSKNVDAIDKYYSKQSENSQKYMLFTKQELLQDYIIAYASSDYDIKKVTPHIKIISSEIKNNIAKINVILKTDICWNASNALGKPIVGIKSEKHIMILNKENNEWKIIIDQYMTNRGHSDVLSKEDLTKLNETIEQLKQEAKDSLNRAKVSRPTRLTLAFSESKIMNDNRRIMSTFNPELQKNGAISDREAVNNQTTTFYNRNAAYNWAHTYWNNYSTAYVNLGDQKWKGGDCANFVSQCLRAGGANNDKAGTYQWYYDNKSTTNTADDSYSWTWSTARGLNYVVLGNYTANETGPKGTQKAITGDIEYNASIGQFITLGDIIQYQWKPTMTITHSAVIVDMLYNSSKERYEPVIAEHTYDSWYTPWINNAYKTYFVHIEGVN